MGTRSSALQAPANEASQKLSWLEQVAADGTLTGACGRLAILVATRFLQAGSGGKGVLSVARAAKALGRSEQTLSTAVIDMEDRGHWRIMRRRGTPLKFEIIIIPDGGFQMRTRTAPDPEVPKNFEGVQDAEVPKEVWAPENEKCPNFQGWSEEQASAEVPQEIGGVVPKISREKCPRNLGPISVENTVDFSVAPGARSTRAPGLSPSGEEELYDSPPPAPEGLPERYDIDPRFTGEDPPGGPLEAAADDDAHSQHPPRMHSENPIGRGDEHDMGWLRVVPRPDGKFDVVGEDDVTVAAAFDSNAAAWRWIDRHSSEGRGDSERFQRIGTAFEEG